MNYGFERITEFAMNITKLNLTNLVGEIMATNVKMLKCLCNLQIS